jgi:Leucine-rich repeat (LRR) protein
LYENQISDISPLSGLSNLTELSLDNNQISDISALSSLTNLEYLWLEGNPVIMNMSWEEIMEVLSGAEGLTYVDF